MTLPNSNTGIERYLPHDISQWNERIAALTRELRRPDITPIKAYLYARTEDGVTCACIGGIINDLAIRGGINAEWTETDWLLPSGEYSTGTAWETTVTPDDPDGSREENFSLPIPEAALYHGLNLEQNLPFYDLSEMSPEFWRFVNREHGAALGAESVVKLNDRHIGTSTNPLLLYADILDHMLGIPQANFWHPHVNQWHP